MAEESAPGNVPEGSAGAVEVANADGAAGDADPGLVAQSSRVSIRPVGREASKAGSTNGRPHTTGGSPERYSAFGARGGKFSNAKPKSSVDWEIYRAKQTPGPGEYGTNSDNIISGGRFNMAKPKSETDWIIKFASERPGPGDYKLNEKASQPSGGRFSTARPKSALDWTILSASQRPGPGHYDADKHYKTGGGRFSSSKPKSEVEWIMHRAKQQPGPGQYETNRDKRMSGGRFNLAKPKSEVDWIILRAGQTPSAQDYNSDAHYKVGGGRFSTAKPKSPLDWMIYNAKQMPGPGEYNSELHAIGRRSAGGTMQERYNPSSPTAPPRPKTSHALPPEARGRVKPKNLDEMSSDSRYGIGNKEPKRPATAQGMTRTAVSSATTGPSAAPRKPVPAPKPVHAVPRAVSAPPGPRPIKASAAAPSKGSATSKKDSVYSGAKEPTVHAMTKSSRPVSILEGKAHSRKTKTISTQASAETWRLQEMQQKDALRNAQLRDAAPPSNPSRRRLDESVGRPGTPSETRAHPLSRSELGSSKPDSKRVAAKRLPVKKKQIAYPAPKMSAAASQTRLKLSDNARKLFDLAMQSGDFRNMMELYTGVKDPTQVIEKYAQMWSYQPLFDGRRTR